MGRWREREENSKSEKGGNLKRGRGERENKKNANGKWGNWVKWKIYYDIGVC